MSEESSYKKWPDFENINPDSTDPSRRYQRQRTDRKTRSGKRREFSNKDQHLIHPEQGEHYTQERFDYQQPSGESGGADESSGE